MNLFLYYLEFSSFINPRHGYDLNRPSFAKQVWPLLLLNSDEVDRVFLFLNSYWAGSRKMFTSGEPVSACIADLGPLAWFTDARFREVGARSSDSDHFNFLFQTSAASPLLPKLFDLWPFDGKLRNAPREDLGLRADELAELIGFVHSLPASHVLLSLGQGAEPLYVFGAQTTLNALLTHNPKSTRNR